MTTTTSPPDVDLSGSKRQITVSDHRGARVSIGTRVVSNNGEGPMSGVVVRITDTEIWIKSDQSKDRWYFPLTWFLGCRACGWIADRPRA